MKDTLRNRRGPLAGALTIGTAMSLAPPAGAGDDFTMDWHSIDCGEGTSATERR